eukprot:10479122-Karenia_brevis.AAC.1
MASGCFGIFIAVAYRPPCWRRKQRVTCKRMFSRREKQSRSCKQLASTAGSSDPGVKAWWRED